MVRYFYLFFPPRTREKYSKTLLLDYCIAFSSGFHSSEVLPGNVLMMEAIINYMGIISSR